MIPFVSIRVFIRRPRSTAVLALLFLVLGLVFVSGLIPMSSNRRYFVGHEWVLASISWIMALLFAYCSARGLKLLSRRARK